MTEQVDRVLLVDDEQAVLDGLCRQHRKHFTLVAACGPVKALTVLAEEGPFAVVVSDYQMPKMDGGTFLAEASRIAPDMSRVMLTGQADLGVAVDAVNRGKIFRFLTKPCEAELFRAVVDAGIDQYNLVNAERLLLERTVKGAVEVLSEVLALSNPAAFGRAGRIHHYVRHVVTELRLPNAWQYETAALLSQIGCVAVPNDLFERVGAGECLPPDQAAIIERHPQLAGQLIRKIPRLHKIADIVSSQRDPRLDPKRDAETLLGAMILGAATDYEELISLGANSDQAIAALRQLPRGYDPRILDKLQGAGVRSENTIVSILPLRKMEPGMVLQEEIRNINGGALVVPQGHMLTVSSLARLRNYADSGLLQRRDWRVRQAVGALDSVA